MNEYLPGLIWLVVLLVVNAFFVGAEFAVISARRSQIEPVPSKRLRRLASVSCDSELEDALASMRRLGAHVATAFDADGTVTGVLFLEDIIEELVGQVEDATSI
ncbi:hypothetical protein E3O06_05185 [Cryobacterium glaciale]|uniref:CBS domain-containing protein n=1 Tax=Cryobacterium glaciale TaxID=1259145 RepID=A0A4R8V067_9MICO|nr:hypothetical protein E3O06_05185 [Cryobacterium glaciale]